MTPSSQLGFDALLTDADATNRAKRLERETGHLPSTMEDALPYCRALIERHHAAMLAADENEAMRLKKEAHALARRLNGGAPGILAHEGAPGCVLERECAAPDGSAPLWGQKASFTITVADMPVRIEMDGLFGICFHSVWPGFSANAVDFTRPFLSETGYRSFLGIHAEAVPGLTPEAFARHVIASYVARELKGRLRPIPNESAAGAPVDVPSEIDAPPQSPNAKFLCNSQMKPGRYLRWCEARGKLARIREHLDSGGAILLSTHTRSSKYTVAHRDHFRATQDGLLCRRARQWDCIDYCAIRFVRQ